MCDREKERKEKEKVIPDLGHWSYFRIPIRRIKMGTQYVSRIIFDRVVLFS